MTHPFEVPARLPPDLARVDAYWRGLLRGSAEVPFWDDADLTSLPDLSDRLMLIGVFERPERFRFEMLGARAGDANLTGRFLDEVKLAWPLEFLRSQCSVTTECGEPTCFRFKTGDEKPYTRLLLPMWGEGHISLLLGCVDFT